jgi:hypothetical protein
MIPYFVRAFKVRSYREDFYLREMSDWGMEKIYNKEFQDLYSLPSILTN